MIVWMLSVALGATVDDTAPESLRSATTDGTFRDSLDFLEQPARLSWQQGVDVWSQLALRSGSTGLDLGTVAAVKGGAIGANVRFVRSSTRSNPDDAPDPFSYNSNDLRFTLATSHALSPTWGFGFGVWGHARLGSMLSWSPGANDGALDAPSTDVRVHKDAAQAGLRVGFVHQVDDRVLDVHARLVWSRELDSAHGSSDGMTVDGFVDDAILDTGVHYAAHNQDTWAGALTVDHTRPTHGRLALRTFVDVLAQGGGVAQAHFDQTVERLGEVHSTWSQDGSLGGALDLRVLGRARWDKLELWFGGRLTAAYASFHGVRDLTETDADGVRVFAESTAALTRNGTLQLGVPIALEAKVHPRVTFRAAALVYWHMTGTGERFDTVEAFDAAPISRGWSDATGGSAHTGVRWKPVDLLDWDVDLGASSSAGARGGYAGGATPDPTIPDLSYTGFSGFNLDLSVRTSLTLRL